MDYDAEQEELIFFVGEFWLSGGLEKREAKTSLEGRRFEVSAAMIRENLAFIEIYRPTFPPSFTQKEVLIIGSASDN